jgi:hypothetical protein
MKLKVTDQIHVSWVQPDTLRPNDVISVTAEQGADLLKAHPDKFEKVAGSDKEHVHAEKAEPANQNKMEAPATNKSGRKGAAK